MNVNDYQNFVNNCPLLDDPALGLPGEVGEVIELIKKDRRPAGWRKEINYADLTKELGDVLWYLTKTASQYGITLSDVIELNVAKLTKRYKL